MLMRPSNDATIMLKSFMGAKDEDFLVPPPPPQMSQINSLRCNLDKEFSMIGQEDCSSRNSNASTLILPKPSEKEMVRVFLRIKPKTEEESHYYSVDSSVSEDAQDENTIKITDEKPTASEDAKTTTKTTSDFEVVSIETEYQLAVTAPPDSAAYKNSINGAGKLTHRYTFSKIFPPQTDQSGLFSDMVLPRIKDFVLGTNQLIFAYGATCSGKTFTIQGDSSRPGILPRALDVLFNSIGSSQLTEADGGSCMIKPLGFSRVATLTPREAERVANEKRAIFELGKELKLELSEVADSTADDNHSIASMMSRVRDETKIDLSDTDNQFNYAIWVSFAEIYNENVYDLLEKMPEPKYKGDRPRRMPLKIAEDRGGYAYIKGLKEVSVTSADEAYQLLIIGRQNLQFAATRLNHNSSRSHCIFTIKIVRVVDKDRPNCARVSMLSFCDLAGSERVKKTMTTGERQKEAGNINTSLLVLGRCIKAIRHNQNLADKNNHKQQQIVPFRESKLTRMLQAYFTGLGKVSMVVNISQSPYLFDESLQVLKFSAIASKVYVEEKLPPPPPQPLPPSDCFEMPAPPGASKRPQNQNKKRKTRFSILVDNNKKSLLGGRGSIAWENPLGGGGRLTSFYPGKAMAESTVINNDTTLADFTMAAGGCADETVIDTKYDGLLKIIEDLKNQLIDEKQANLKLENEVRTELCEEFNKMMVEIETSWEQRLQEEKDRATELNDWRISKLEEAYKRKRHLQRAEESASMSTHHDQSGEIEKLETTVKDKAKEIDQLQGQIKAMKEMHDTVLEEKKKESKANAKISQDLEAERKKVTTLEESLSKIRTELDDTNKALEEQSAEPKIANLEATVTELKETVEAKQAQVDDLKVLLDEAGEEYVAKDEELSMKDKYIEELKVG